jgi:phage shock protein PspC (stress-responsive transcriptional regulator)
MDNKRLSRSTSDRMVAGVAGGIAEYLSVDPVVVRILFAALALFGGGGIILYLVCWLLMPEES